MTETERLRQLLDKRGVEWWEEDGHTLWYGQSIHHAASAFSSFMFGENDKVHLNAMVSPEQAVEATLGRGTCEVVSKPCDMWECECGKAWWQSGAPNFCPNCGREVVE